MVLTDYYKFKKVALKSKMRMDCIYSTHSYPEFEEKRAVKATTSTEKRDATEIGNLVVYFGDVPDVFGGNVKRKAGKTLTIKGENVSSIFVPDPESNMGYGDYKGTNDALLVVFHDLNIIDGRVQSGGVIEVFIARGKSRDRVPLYNLLSDGGLDAEMDCLRMAAEDDNKHSLC